MRKRIFSIVICLALCLSLLPNLAHAAGTEANVGTWDEFSAALKNPDVTTINITADIIIPTSSQKDDALVIGGGGKELAITSKTGKITLRPSGLVLGGDVTFRDIELEFANPVRNAIVANGHALTLENVTSAGAYNISLFCGGITDYCGGNQAEIPAPGNAGHITVRGKNNLGNIYAGSLSDVVDGVSDAPNDYTGAAVVTLEPGADGMGDIYAHGARENRAGGSFNDMIADASQYKATGGVTVNLSNNPANVYGATGGSRNAAVNFTDAGNGYQYSPLLQDIGSLSLRPGSTSASLSLKAGSSFSPGASVSVPEKTRLDFGKMPENNITVGSLDGGGILVLGASQKLTIDGGVTGTTKIAVGDVNFDETLSTGTVTVGQAYLMAAKAAENSFLLLPPNGKDLMFQKEADGSWIAAEGGTTSDPKVASFGLGDVSVASGVAEALLPVTAEDGNGQNIAQELVLMDGITVSVNGTTAPYDQDTNTYVSDTGLALFFDYNEAGDGSVLVVEPSSAAEIPDGAYTISAAIPGASTVSGQELSASALLAVGAEQITDGMVRLSATEFIYNGNPQKPSVTVEDGSTGLVENQDYTVAYQRDGKATDDFTSAGTVTVVITGMGSYFGKAETSFTIKKAPAPVLTWPQAGNLTYGQPLTDSLLTGGSTAYGSFSWKNPDTVPAGGSMDYPVVFTPSKDTLNNYETIINTENPVTVKVEKAMPGMVLSATVAQDGNVALKVTLAKAGKGVFPGGTVQFTDVTDGGAPQDIGSPVRVGADGTASCNFAAPEKKEYTLQATYSGDTNYMTHTVNKTIDTRKQSQKELIITSVATVSYGQTLTLTTSGGSTGGSVTYTISPSDGATVSGNILTPSKTGTVTVTATMAGNDVYLDVTSAPVTITINRGTGVGSVTMADWNYGETASEPLPVSDTNGIDHVTYLYKQKDANDDSYTADKPVNAGTYTVKATFAATANYTEAVATADFTIHESTNPGDGEPTTPDAPSVEIPVSGGSTVNIKAVIEGSTATLQAFTQEEIDKLVDGTANVISIDLSGSAQKIDKVNLPAATIEALKEAAEKTDTEESLAITFSTGTVRLDEKTIEAVAEQSGGSQIQLVLDKTGIDGLTNVQQEAIQDMKVYECMEAYLICTQSGERISDFRGGTATIEIPFAVPSGLEASGFTVWYVDENGAKTKLDGGYKDGNIEWKVGHFSDFVIAYTEADNPGDDNSNPGDDNSNPGGGSTNPDGDTSNPGGSSNPDGDTSNPGGGSNSGGSDTTSPGSQSGGNKTDISSPKTGDEASVLFYVMLMLFSCLGFVKLAAVKKN